MNREIKFRAWDKYKKQMYFVSSIDYDIFSQEIRTISIAHENGMCTAYNKNHNSEECDITALELMQSTGLNDKNGKEIYRGDIVQVLFADKEESGIKGQVIYSNDQASYIVIDRNNDDWELGYLDNLEVIGNIYENSELLGGE